MVMKKLPHSSRRRRRRRGEGVRRSHIIACPCLPHTSLPVRDILSWIITNLISEVKEEALSYTSQCYVLNPHMWSLVESLYYLDILHMNTTKGI